jgi:hypothetical protein
VSGRLLAVALGLALGGCAAASRVTASRDDYMLYRETRVAATLEQRLAAGGRYLRERPEGRFRREVERWFAEAEPRFFAQAHDRPSLLRAYLRALPEGPHAKQAAARLEEFSLMNQFRARNASASRAFAKRVEADLVAAEAGRQRLVREVSALATLLARTRSFGAPTSELPHELIDHFRLPAPAGSCSEERCAKSFRFAYAVPDAGKLSRREAEFVLALELERGLLRRMSLAGPALFNRLAEAVDRVPVSSSNLLARTEAIARAVQIFDNATASAFPAAECRRDVIAPVVFARECEGVAFTVSAALEPTGDDRVDVTSVSVAAKGR